MKKLKANAAAWQLNLKVIIWTTLVGGFISSLVKWGSEVNMPPRVPGEISPPAAHIEAWFGWMGIHPNSLDYVYQSVNIPGLVTIYHWLFSFASVLIYVILSAYWPKIRLWFGAFYGILVTLATHGFIIPLLGFRYPVYADGAKGWLWNLNAAELWSEFLGHIYWGFSIEVCMIAVLAYLARPIKGNDWVAK